MTARIFKLEDLDSVELSLGDVRIRGFADGTPTLEELIEQRERHAAEVQGTVQLLPPAFYEPRRADPRERARAKAARKARRKGRRR